MRVYVRFRVYRVRVQGLGLTGFRVYRVSGSGLIGFRVWDPQDVYCMLQGGVWGLCRGYIEVTSGSYRGFKGSLAVHIGKSFRIKWKKKLRLELYSGL